VSCCPSTPKALWLDPKIQEQWGNLAKWPQWISSLTSPTRLCSVSQTVSPQTFVHCLAFRPPPSPRQLSIEPVLPSSSISTISCSFVGQLPGPPFAELVGKATTLPKRFLARLAETSPNALADIRAVSWRQKMTFSKRRLRPRTAARWVLLFRHAPRPFICCKATDAGVGRTRL
jgi:hypothetical protein